MRLGHPVQHRVIPDAAEVINLQLVERVECSAARKDRVHPDQNADSGKCFEESARRLQREVMDLLRTVLPGLAKPRSRNGTSSMATVTLSRTPEEPGSVQKVCRSRRMPFFRTPLPKNREVLLAAQHAEEAGKRRLRGRQP